MMGITSKDAFRSHRTSLSTVAEIAPQELQNQAEHRA